MKLINLLPKIQRREVELQMVTRQVIKFFVWSAGSVAVFLLLAFGVMLYLKGEMIAVDKDIAGNRKELTSTGTQQLQEKVLAVNKQVKVIGSLRDQHYYWTTALIEISKLLPADAQINSLDIDRQTGEIKLTGTAEKRESVIQFWANVKKSKYFKNINFPLSNLEREKNSLFTYTFYANKEMLKDELPE
ncbi:MAG: PilN domain-containing protein [Candidatus Saccharibacteria bacterium]